MFLLNHLEGALRHPLHRVRPACAASAVGVQLNLRYAADAEPWFGEGFATTYSSERLEVGARVAIDAALHVSPGAYLLPLVGLEVTYYPLPYHLLAAPSGVVTSTPSVWAGATAGLRWNVL